MNQLDRLLDLLFTPAGFLGVAITLVFVTVLYKKQYRPLHWFLVSATGFAASLNAGERFPSLAFPLEQIRAQGRPLTIILLGLVLIIIYLSKRGAGASLMPSPLPYLIFIQGLAFVHTIFGGDQFFAILAILTFGGMVLMMLYGPSRWMETEADFKWGVLVIAMVGMIFAVVNLYQWLIDSYPITFTHGRLLGTTGNPQHAATLLGATIPAFLYLVEEETRRPWLKGVWLAFLSVITLGLFMTGSRTGLGIAVIGVLLFYGGSIKIITRLILVALAFFIVTLFFEPAQQWVLETIGPNLDRFSDLGIGIDESGEINFGSRDGVWRYQWRQFTENIWFGTGISNRIHVGENSWLGVAARFGLLGVIPLLLFAWECLKMMGRLYQYGKRQPKRQKECNVVIAGLLALMAGAWFEGYLVGIITFSVMALIQYLILGKFLLQMQRQERIEQQVMLIETRYGY